MVIELTQVIGRRITTIAEDTRETTFLSNAFQWLCKEEMRFLSTTPWSQSKLPLHIIIKIIIIVIIIQTDSPGCSTELLYRRARGMQATQSRACTCSSRPERSIIHRVCLCPLSYIHYAGGSIADVSCRGRWPPPTTLALTTLLGS